MQIMIDMETKAQESATRPSSFKKWGWDLSRNQSDSKLNAFKINLVSLVFNFSFYLFKNRIQFN